MISYLHSRISLLLSGILLFSNALSLLGGFIEPIQEMPLKTTTFLFQQEALASTAIPFFQDDLGVEKTATLIKDFPPSQPPSRWHWFNLHKQKEVAHNIAFGTICADPGSLVAQELERIVRGEFNRIRGNFPNDDAFTEESADDYYRERYPEFDFSQAREDMKEVIKERYPAEVKSRQGRVIRIYYMEPPNGEDLWWIDGDEYAGALVTKSFMICSLPLFAKKLNQEEREGVGLHEYGHFIGKGHTSDHRSWSPTVDRTVERVAEARQKRRREERQHQIEVTAKARQESETHFLRQFFQTKTIKGEQFYVDYEWDVPHSKEKLWLLENGALLKVLPYGKGFQIIARDSPTLR